MAPNEASEARAFYLAELERLETRLSRRTRLAKYMPAVFALCTAVGLAALADTYHFAGTTIFALIMLTTGVGALSVEAQAFRDQDLLVLKAAIRELYRHPGE